MICPHCGAEPNSLLRCTDCPPYPGENFLNPRANSRIELQRTDLRGVAACNQPGAIMPARPPSDTDFKRFTVKLQENGVLVLYKRDGARIGAIEPCGWGPISLAFHHFKTSHPKTKHLVGVLQVGRAHYIIYSPDGSHAIYHLA